MKKLMILAAVAAMACGVQAAINYTWTIDISKIAPDYFNQLPTDLTAQLMEGSQLLGYLDIGMFATTPNDKGEYLLDTAAANSTAQTYFLDTDYSSGNYKVGDTVGDSNTRAVHVSADFASASNLRYSSGETERSLRVVLSGTDQMTKAKQYQTLDVTWTGDTTLGVSGTYAPTDTPEPTSGLLMLLGMAGLALKRKRA